MRVKELKKLLEEVDEDREVVIFHKSCYDEISHTYTEDGLRGGYGDDRKAFVLTHFNS